MDVVWFDRKTGDVIDSECHNPAFFEHYPDYVIDRCIEWDAKAQVLNADGTINKLVNY